MDTGLRSGISAHLLKMGIRSGKMIFGRSEMEMDFYSGMGSGRDGQGTEFRVPGS